MKLITPYRIIKLSLTDFVRLPWLSLASSLMMGITLLVIAAFILLHGTLQQTAQELRDKVEATVFLKDDASEEQLFTLIEQLRARNDIREVKYIDKKQALLVFKERFGDSPAFLSFISEDRNPLPRSLIIKTRAPEDIGNIGRFLEQEEFIPMIKRLPFADLALFVNRLVSLASFLSSFGIIASLTFIVLSIMIIFNSIALSVSTRSGEIEIMRLVGATKFFIRTPFLLLGMLYGGIGAIVAGIILYLLGQFAVPLADRYLEGFVFVPSTFYQSQLLRVIFIIAITGMFAGAFVSALAVRRTLRR